MHTAAHQPTHTRPHTHTRAVTSQVADVLTLCTLIASDLAEGRSCCKREREREAQRNEASTPFSTSLIPPSFLTPSSLASLAVVCGRGDN